MLLFLQFTKFYVVFSANIYINMKDNRYIEQKDKYKKQDILTLHMLKYRTGKLLLLWQNNTPTKN